jgi:hypothetical protein
MWKKLSQYLILAWGFPESNSWKKNEKLSQYTKNMKIIFTIEQEIFIDMSDDVVYYVYRGSSHAGKI